MKYRVILRQMRVELDIGIHAHEIGVKQGFTVDIVIEVDRLPLDDGEYYFDYDNVRDEVLRLAASPRVNYQEELALHLVEFCRKQPHVVGVIITTSKPDIFEDVQDVGCQLAWGTLEAMPPAVQV